MTVSKKRDPNHLTNGRIRTTDAHDLFTHVHLAKPSTTNQMAVAAVKKIDAPSTRRCSARNFAAWPTRRASETAVDEVSAEMTHPGQAQRMGHEDRDAKTVIGWCDEPCVHVPRALHPNLRGTLCRHITIRTTDSALQLVRDNSQSPVKTRTMHGGENDYP